MAAPWRRDGALVGLSWVQATGEVDPEGLVTVVAADEVTGAFVVSGPAVGLVPKS
jgi:hypothetical protein